VGWELQHSRLEYVPPSNEIEMPEPLTQAFKGRVISKDNDKFIAGLVLDWPGSWQQIPASRVTMTALRTSIKHGRMDTYDVLGRDMTLDWDLVTLCF